MGNAMASDFFKRARAADIAPDWSYEEFVRLLNDQTGSRSWGGALGDQARSQPMLSQEEIQAYLDRVGARLGYGPGEFNQDAVNQYGGVPRFDPSGNTLNDFSAFATSPPALMLGGAFLGGALGGAGSSGPGLLPADIAAGAVPEFGTEAAYAAGMGNGGGMYDMVDLYSGGGWDEAGMMMDTPSMPPAVPEPDPTFGGVLEQTGD